MAILNDLGKKISQTSQGVVKKTKDTSAIIKLNGAINDEKKLIEANIKQIGELYYQTRANNPDKEFAPFINAISDAQNRINQYSENINQLKGLVKCPQCDNDIPYEAAFCSKCGYRMPERINPNTRQCPNCGKMVGNNSQFCTSCGHPMPNQTTQQTTPVQEMYTPPQVSPTPQTTPTPVVPTPTVESINQPAASDALNVCPNCGTDVPADVAFCVQCGMNLQEQPLPFENQDTNQCPNCGAIVDKDMTFCANCGNSLTNQQVDISSESPVSEVPEEPVPDVPEESAQNTPEQTVPDNPEEPTPSIPEQTVSDNHEEPAPSIPEQTVSDNHEEPAPNISEQTENDSVCPNCGYSIPDGMYFCNNCGTVVKHQPTEQDNQNMKQCPVCGAMIPNDMNFCTNCGNQIENTGNSNQPQSFSEKPTVLYNSDITSSEKTCPQCGSAVSDDMAFCVICGNKLK